MKVLRLLLLTLFTTAFSQETSNSSAAVSSTFLSKLAPDWARQIVVGLELWQWLGIAGIVFVGLAVDLLVTLLLRGSLQQRLRQSSDPLTKRSLRPFGLLVASLLWWAGVALLALPEPFSATLAVAAKFVFTLAASWASYQLVDVFGKLLDRLASGTDSKFDDLLVQLVRTTLKVLIAVIAFVFIATNLDVDLSAILAGLGLGGLAFALAAQDTVRNLFGLVTVLLDRPFQLGDWVVIGDVEGSVERISFRSTRIRTFYNSLITVPNATLITANVNNMGARQYRRFKTTLQITYDTPPAKIETFCEGIREIVASHPYTRKDYYHVYLNGFGAHSLNILLYIFHEVPDWSTELRERQRFMIDVLHLAQKLSVEFAFPTQTLYMQNPESHQALSEKSTFPEEHDMLEARAIARNIVEQSLGEGMPVPPPVVSLVAEGKDRGSAGDGE